MRGDDGGLVVLDGCEIAALAVEDLLAVLIVREEDVAGHWIRGS